MPSQPQPRYTPEEYLALERKAVHKSEYFNGEIFATSGASEAHNLIVTNVVRELSLQFKGRPCKVYAGDMRVKVSPTGLYTYPDVVALCGEPHFNDDQKDTLYSIQLSLSKYFLLPPKLTIEATSSGTIVGLPLCRNMYCCHRRSYT